MVPHLLLQDREREGREGGRGDRQREREGERGREGGRLTQTIVVTTVRSSGSKQKTRGSHNSHHILLLNSSLSLSLSILFFPHH